MSSHNSLDGTSYKDDFVNDNDEGGSVSSSSSSSSPPQSRRRHRQQQQQRARSSRREGKNRIEQEDGSAQDSNGDDEDEDARSRVTTTTVTTTTTTTTSTTKRKTSTSSSSQPMASKTSRKRKQKVPAALADVFEDDDEDDDNEEIKQDRRLLLVAHSTNTANETKQPNVQEQEQQENFPSSSSSTSSSIAQTSDDDQQDDGTSQNQNQQLQSKSSFLMGPAKSRPSFIMTANNRVLAVGEVVVAAPPAPPPPPPPRQANQSLSENLGGDASPTETVSPLPQQRSLLSNVEFTSTSPLAAARVVGTHVVPIRPSLYDNSPTSFNPQNQQDSATNNNNNNTIFLEHLSEQTILAIEDAFATLSRENFETRCAFVYRQYLLRPAALQYHPKEDGRDHQVSPPRPHYKDPPPTRDEQVDHPIFVKPLTCTVGDVQSVLFRSGVHRIPPMPKLIKFIYKAVRQIQVREQRLVDDCEREMKRKRESLLLLQQQQQQQQQQLKESENQKQKRRKSSSAAVLHQHHHHHHNVNKNHHQQRQQQQQQQQVPPLQDPTASATSTPTTSSVLLHSPLSLYTTSPILIDTIGFGRDLSTLRLNAEICCIVAEQMQRASASDCWEIPMSRDDPSLSSAAAAAAHKNGASIRSGVDFSYSSSSTTPGTDLGFQTRRRPSTVSVVSNSDESHDSDDNVNHSRNDGLKRGLFSTSTTTSIHRGAGRGGAAGGGSSGRGGNDFTTAGSRSDFAVFRGVNTALMQFKRSLNLSRIQQQQREQMMAASSPTTNLAGITAPGTKSPASPNFALFAMVNSNNNNNNSAKNPITMGNQALLRSPRADQQQQQQQQQPSSILASKIQKKQLELLELKRQKENKKQSKKLKRMVRKDSFTFRGGGSGATNEEATSSRISSSSSSSSSSSPSSSSLRSDYSDAENNYNNNSNENNNNKNNRNSSDGEATEYGFFDREGSFTGRGEEVVDAVDDDDDDGDDELYQQGDVGTVPGPGSGDHHHHHRHRHDHPQRGTGRRGGGGRGRGGYGTRGGRGAAAAGGGGKDINLALDNPSDAFFFGETFADLVVTSDDVRERLRDVVKGAVKDLKERRKHVHEWMEEKGVDRRGRLKTAAVPSMTALNAARRCSISNVVDDDDDDGDEGDENDDDDEVGAADGLDDDARRHRKRSQVQNQPLTAQERHAQEVLQLLQQQQLRQQRLQQQPKQQQQLQPKGISIALPPGENGEDEGADDKDEEKEKEKQTEYSVKISDRKTSRGESPEVAYQHSRSPPPLHSFSDVESSSVMSKSQTLGSFAIASLQRTSSVASLDEAALRPPKIWTRYGPVSPVVQTGSHIEVATLGHYRTADDEQRKFEERANRHADLYERLSNPASAFSSSSVPTSTYNNNNNSRNTNNNNGGSGVVIGRKTRSRSISGLTLEQTEKIHASARGPWSSSAALFRHHHHQQYQRQHEQPQAQQDQKFTPHPPPPPPSSQQSDFPNAKKTDSSSAVKRTDADVGAFSSSATSFCRGGSGGGVLDAAKKQPLWVMNTNIEAPIAVTNARERNSYERHVAMMRSRPPREVPKDFFIKNVPHPKRPTSARPRPSSTSCGALIHDK